MLSNTEDRKPRPSAVCQEASGSSSTGISEALVTSASRKIVPLKVSGMISQSGRRSGAVARITIHTASPITGTTSSRAGNFRLAMTFARIAMIRIAATMPQMGPFDPQAARRILQDRRMAMLLQRRRDAVDQEAGRGRHIGVQHATAG